ncbi:SDR family NAD(P)-dependent oxidoreductase [Flavobacterium sp. DG1-102-2]|uniref:SDR family NAD(P)-dependent oxidoreductase n=1 Tax=Flavobacterium sp. DG1-102-2 TaxID=3081663 RepID=UPI002949ADE5|nr:SDR family NAD(P)-dependent oxidoreductase [Flavobacterium sp. DG1-102-2]MDV6167590.1 SDR family NAD(P)-dependent oxidoreductase [Flavobacterium sp. DG1-102-2]
MKSFTERVLFPNVSINPKKLANAISGKTIVITGASYGIGEELALLFSGYNAHLILVARTQQKLQAVADTVMQNGSACTIISADLYLENEVDRVIEILKALPGGIDIFISNAGKSITRSLGDSLDRYHDFTRTNALNYLAPVKLLLAATPLLKAANGKIINVSAINVLLLPAPKWAAYQASKTAFDQWFRSNAAEWKIMGVRIATIYLPLVRTRMMAPNKNYKNYPAMQPEQAALRIAKLLYSTRSYTKPWWTVFPQTGSFFGRYVWEKISFLYLKR